MKFLDKIFSNTIFKKLKENEDLIERQLENCISENEAEIMADDYFHLLKHLHKNPKPSNVILDPNDYYAITVDGIIYDLDDCIRHNDIQNTERKMEIEALFCDGTPIDEVQHLLDLKIKNEW